MINVCLKTFFFGHWLCKVRFLVHRVLTTKIMTMKVCYVVIISNINIINNNNMFFQQYGVENLMNVLCCQLNYPASCLVFQAQGKGVK